MTLEVGETVALTATVEIVRGSPNTAVTWTSGNATIASVDEDGTVTANAAGTTTITATSVFDTDASGNATITVTEPDPELQSIAATAAAAGAFSVLLAALEEAGLDTTFADDDAGPFTVFAPTDAAFTDLLTLLDATPEELLARDDLTAILTYHVVDGAVLAADILDLIDAGDGSADIETLNGAFITATFDGTNVILNGDITVDPTDILATNGVIHVIDGVLVTPMELTTDANYETYTADANISTEFDLAFPAFTGGLAPFTFELDGDLPDAFVPRVPENGDFVPGDVSYEVGLDDTTGAIAGATGFPGVFSGSVTVTDALGQTLTAAYELDLGIAFRYTANDLETTADTFSYPNFSPPGPYFIVAGNRVQVSGVQDTDLLPEGFLEPFTFLLEYIDSDGSREPTPEEIGDGQTTGTFRINVNQGAIGRYTSIPAITQWYYDVTVTHPDADSVTYPVRFHHTSAPFDD